VYYDAIEKPKELEIPRNYFVSAILTTPEKG